MIERQSLVGVTMTNDDSQNFSVYSQIQARLQQVQAECNAEQRQNETNFREVGATSNRQQVEIALLNQRVNRLEQDINQGFASLREQIKGMNCPVPAPTTSPIVRQILVVVACAIATTAATSILTLTYDKPDHRPAVTSTK